MPINKINNVSFGAKLILDEQTKYFITNNLNEKEINRFQKRINDIGIDDDVVEINNLTKHSESELKDIKNSHLLEGQYATVSPCIVKYTTDLKINGETHKVVIKPSYKFNVDVPLMQIAAIVKNELNKTNDKTLLKLDFYS